MWRLVWAAAGLWGFGLTSIGCAQGHATALCLEAIPGNSPNSFGIRLSLAGKESSPSQCLRQETPAVLEVLDAQGSRTLLRSGYDKLEQAAPGRFVGSTTLTSPGGSIFRLTDSYDLSHSQTSQGVVIERSVLVEKASPQDAGFHSRVLFEVPGSTPFDRLEPFMPGLWWKSSAHLPEWAIGGNPKAHAYFAREDRLGAPLLALFDPATSIGVTLLKSPSMGEPNTVEADKNTTELVEARLGFGSLGLSRPGAEGSRGANELGWIYPGSEFERTYVDLGDGKRTSRYHPIKAGFVQTSTLLLRAERYREFSSMMEEAWRWAWQQWRPRVRSDIDLNQAYDALAGALCTMYRDYGQAMSGVPTGAHKDTGEIYDRTIEMGFLGPQLRMAAVMLHKGLTEKNDALTSVATTMLDQWARNSGEGLAHTKWSFAERGWIDEGRARGEVFLRSECEGHLHMLEAFQTSRSFGKEREAWGKWALSLAPWLADNQNPDGSWYRKYATDGRVVERSKTGSAWPIPYLCAAAQETGRNEWLQAAQKAGEFAWKEYGSQDAYMGGTLDNADVLDKEAAFAALEAFSSLYESTSQTLWLKRACRAATVAESWHYIVDIPPALDAPQKDWAAGDSTAGLGFVCAGHSGVDTYASCHVLPFVKLYRWTGDPHYSQFAKLQLYNTKQPLDLEKKKGFYHPGLMSEIWVFSIGWLNTTRTNECRGLGHTMWVPWTTANAAWGMQRLLGEPGGWNWEMGRK